MRYAKITNGVVTEISIPKPMIKKSTTVKINGIDEIEITLVRDSSWVDVSNDVWCDFTQNPDGSFSPPVVVPTPISEDDVKAECLRRMLVAFTANNANHLSQKISESIQVSIELFDKGKDNWDATDTATAEHLRAARLLERGFDISSKAIRSVAPIPDDYEDDKYWPSNV